MNILEKIRKDHKKARSLIAEITELDSHKENTKKLMIFDQLKTELLAHEHSEEKTLYKEMKHSKINELNEQADHGIEVHKEIQDLINRVSSARSDNEDWSFKFKLLKDRLERHMKEEEKEIFDTINESLGSSMQEYLGHEMQEAKQEEMSVHND